ncbi:HAD-IA family hydrolase [Ectothiorhodospiraceae bacterium 2226]|nr:HAD-IA family hydrolase [Ectothiorhodospiraceae bacterium 2226]
MDSADRIVSCLRQTVHDLGLDPRSDAALRDIIGLGLREAVEQLYPDCDDALFEAFKLRYRHHFLAPDAQQPALFPQARATLERLSEEGYFLAVATGKGRQGLDRVLAATGCARYFHATRCADECHSKPHPAMLQELTDYLGVEARETLMVGDSEYDILMAANAGAAALGVSFGVHGRDRLLRAGARHCVDSVPEVRDWLRDQALEVPTPVRAE